MSCRSRRVALTSLNAAMAKRRSTFLFGNFMLAATMVERGKQLGSQAEALRIFVTEKEHGGPFLPVT